MTAAVERLSIGGPLEPWRRLGLFVTDDGLIPLFGRRTITTSLNRALQPR